ncbi:uncharacterized protein LOC135706658 isoform X2 [Ochlerotatus camptorhynchus]|uniref:uncharacterized protein LOC135706658 isoform X2 n=1 Tax=Ochlerotatus camptorhynchus TaxID=644619 RepID=UPI0031D1BD26
MDYNQVVPNDSAPAKEVESDLLHDIRMDTANCDPATTESWQNSAPKRSYYDHDEIDGPEMEPQKKLCRYYYLDRCMRAESCSFMHSEFPCKFYYFGYECKDGKNCKLLHGSALDPTMTQALWHHVMSAPANLLQRFPCFPHVLLKQNFDDRHNELIQMEQEGLLEDREMKINPVSSTLLSEVIKTVSKTQVTGDAFAQLGELLEILTPEQIASLASIGVETMDQLFQLGASSLLDLGFDFDTLIKIGNFKEIQRKKSIYTAEIDEDSQNDINTSDIFGSEVLDVSLTAPVDTPVLTDQELLSILNEDLNTSTSTIERSSAQDFEATLSDRDLKPKLYTINCDDFPGDQNDAYSGISKEFVDVNSESSQGSGCALKAFRSDAGSECHQLMLYPSVKEMENDKKSLDSIQRTVDQLKKIDSLLSEEKKQDTSWGSEENDVSTGHGPRHDSYVTDSVNQSFGSESDSQTCFRMPFKSIINHYTPATEIDASNGKFLITQYKLIPVDVPKPNFERIRRTFVAAPTYSLDPRLQIMFNVGPTEVRHVDCSKVSIRDPRLKKSTEVHIGDVPDHPA